MGASDQGVRGDNGAHAAIEEQIENGSLDSRIVTHIAGLA
jgi:hypothetical protein